MAIEVRAIASDAELEGWVAATHVAFHAGRSAAPEAAFRRDVLHQDLRRTLAAVDGDVVAGTLYSFPAELSLPGGTSLLADAVSAVSVLPTYRRRGLFTRLLKADLHAARERGEVASILIPAEYPIYGRFGFGPATERADYAIDAHAAEFTRAAPGPVQLVEPARLRDLAPPMAVPLASRALVQHFLLVARTSADKPLLAASRSRPSSDGRLRADILPPSSPDVPTQRWPGGC